MKIKDPVLKDYDIEDLEDILIRIENSFEIRFAENELTSVETFGQLSDAIINKIRIQETEDCTSQQAFYKLRLALKSEIGLENIEPTTELKQVFPRKQRIRNVKRVEEKLGFKLGIVGPTDFIISLLALLLMGSLFGFIFDWLVPLIGIIFSLLGINLANKTGAELKCSTIREVAEKMKREHYFNSRRDLNTGNMAEIKQVIIDIFAASFDIDKSKLTRETQLI